MIKTKLKITIIIDNDDINNKYILKLSANVIDRGENIDVRVDIIIIDVSFWVFILKDFIISCKLIRIQLFKTFNHSPGGFDKLIIKIKLKIRRRVYNLLLKLTHKHLLDRVDFDWDWNFLKKFIREKYLLDSFNRNLLNRLIFLAEI